MSAEITAWTQKEKKQHILNKKPLPQYYPDALQWHGAILQVNACLYYLKIGIKLDLST
jgi:hypothetical protein